MFSIKENFKRNRKASYQVSNKKAFGSSTLKRQRQKYTCGFIDKISSRVPNYQEGRDKK